MLVVRKGSKKRKRKLYEVFDFTYGNSLLDLISFIGDLGEINIDSETISKINIYTWIDLEDGRRICPGQFLIKWRGKILSFDPTIFYEWFEYF